MLSNQDCSLRDEVEVSLKLGRVQGFQVFGKGRWEDGNKAGPGMSLKGI